MIAQEPIFPSSKAYPHLTLQPPVQSHQPSDTIHFTQVPLQQSHATHFTVAPALKSDTFSSRPVASRQDDIGRSLGNQQSHFLVNDVNIEHEDSATSVNEVHVGSTEEVRQRQQNELQQRLRKEREAAAHKWAPVVWLDPKEIFFPGNVLDFLDNINISSSEGIDIREYGREAGLPQGPLSEEMHLLAPLDTECCNCPLPAFLHGQRPFRGEGPPVYAHIHTCFSAIARTTAAPTTINMLLRTPPGGEPMKARSLRAQIRYLQHPLPRYRRRRIRGRGRGKRDTVHDAHLADIHSYEHSNETNYETLTRQKKKLVLTEDQLEEQHIKLPNEGNEGIKRKVQGSMLTNTVKMESVSLNRPSTEPKNATQPGITANLTSSEVDTTFGVTSERNTRSHQDDQHFSNLPHTDADIALKTELPPAETQQLPKFPQSQPIPKLTRTSQPIIIIGNYSRMSHVYATAVPAVLQASRQQNSTDATNKNSSNPTENRPPSKANRRHALSTTGTPGHHFTITYWLFYPYNHGKEVCTTNMIFIGRVAKPLYKGECLGETVVMGNHVGDWEHLSIYFEDGEPRYLYLSAHHFGVFYTYQPEWDRFKYSSQDVREGVYMSPVYPQYLELEQGRLVVYSARGSHGIWPSQGRHMYNNVMVKLEDETGQGHLWDTRHRVHIIDALEEKRRGTTDTHRKWFDFRGKWGNPSSNCHPGLLGFCEVRDGPLGITMKRLNFPCHIPRHYTFPKP
ncbi:hypothetical protein FHG87_014695 [Trinorchestia longiramus]|nr:hypothetical protein FHG87_014695 [Trinorchestia longiramus]